jgi:hypothetical protein
LEALLGCNDLSAEQAERYGYINQGLSADELTPFVEKLAHRIASFPPHAIAHAKAAVDTGAFSAMAEGFLVEAHESDLTIFSEATQARVAEALKVGAETYEGELEMDYLARISPIKIASDCRTPQQSRPRARIQSHRRNSLLTVRVRRPRSGQSNRVSRFAIYG